MWSNLLEEIDKIDKSHAGSTDEKNRADIILWMKKEHNNWHSRNSKI